MSDNLEKKGMSLLANTKIRLGLALGGGVILIGAAILGWRVYHRDQFLANVSVSGAPAIQSFPGSSHASDAYVADQNKQNQALVKKALATQTSAVPTITRSSFQGSAEDFLKNPDNQTACHTDGVAINKDPASCSVANLKLARQAGVDVFELRCQGCTCPALKAAGYTAGSLKRSGYDAASLKRCGFSIQSLIAAGFSAQDLKTAGFSPDQLTSAGLVVGAKLPKDLNKDCSVARLKALRDKGYSAIDLKQRGCSLAALKAAGFTAAELKAAGFDAKDLRDMGFSPTQLKAAGFGAEALKQAGFSAGDLSDAGYSPNALLNAGYSPKSLRLAGIKASSLKALGADVLKKAGYTNGDLVRAGMSASDIHPQVSPVNPCSPSGLAHALQTGVSPRVLKDEGCSTDAMLKAGFSKDQLAAAGLVQAANKARDINSLDAASSSSVPAINPTDDIAKRLAALQREQDAQMTAQQRKEQARQVAMQMQAQASKLLSGWSQVSAQQYNVVQVPENTSGSATNIGGASSAEHANQGPVISAGTVMFAVLKTGINTDENSPILATIVSGPLKGAKLVGAFSRLNKKVMLSFKTFSLPSYDRSIPITAVAIDSNTAHTAVSGSVNNHYLLRYGSLFASSFLSGYADALTAGGTSISWFGSTLVKQTTSLTPAQQLAVGAGNVGKQYSNKMAPNFNRPPTVKIPAGTGIGILLTGDLQLPIQLTPMYNKFKKMEKQYHE